MADWSGEEVAAGLQKWLKVRRNVHPKGSPEWIAVDALLDEARDDAAQGWQPWQKYGEAED
jgi:hypothetical protein